MKFINVKFNQKKFFEIKPFNYELTDEEKPSQKEMENDIRENLKNTDFGENAVEKVLNGETVENGLGGFIYANINETGYDLFVCKDRSHCRNESYISV